MIQIGPSLARNIYTATQRNSQRIRHPAPRQTGSGFISVVNTALGVTFPFFKKSKQKEQKRIPVQQKPLKKCHTSPAIRRRGRYVCIRRSLLPHKAPHMKGKKLLVLDLDETLVHSSFETVRNHDFIVRLPIDNELKDIYIHKRPKVDEFLEEVSKIYELCVFTAGSERYASPVIDAIDQKGLISHRLYRKHCTFEGGYFKKDLSLLGRDLSQVLLLDNSSVCYDLQPNNGVPIPSWYEDRRDRELMEMLPWLRDIAKAPVVYKVIRDFKISIKGKLEFPSIVPKKPKSVPIPSHGRVVTEIKIKKPQSFRNIKPYIIRGRKRSGRALTLKEMNIDIETLRRGYLLQKKKEMNV